MSKCKDIMDQVRQRIRVGTSGTTFALSKERDEQMKVVVLHKGGLAHYEVAPDNSAGYKADLQKYTGVQERRPPQTVHFQKQGRHCSGDCTEQDLMDDLLGGVEA